MNPDHIDKRFCKTESLVARKIGDEFIIVPIRRRAGEIESLYTLNEVAARIWELIDGNRSLEQIRDIIVSEYDVAQEEAEKDILEFVQQLESIGALKEA